MVSDCRRIDYRLGRRGIHHVGRTADCIPVWRVQGLVGERRSARMLEIDEKKVMEQLRERLKEKFAEGKKLPIHNCTMCGYECGFSWLDGQLHYDTGCHCTGMSGGFEPREESALDFYLEKESWVKEFEEALEK